MAYQTSLSSAQTTWVFAKLITHIHAFYNAVMQWSADCSQTGKVHWLGWLPRRVPLAYLVATGCWEL